MASNSFLNIHFISLGGRRKKKRKENKKLKEDQRHLTNLDKIKLWKGFYFVLPMNYGFVAAHYEHRVISLLSLQNNYKNTQAKSTPNIYAARSC